MYNSVAVHIENGQVILDEPLVLKDNTKVVLTILEDKIKHNHEPNGKKLSIILEEILKTDHAYRNIDPIAWQREIRTDRKLGLEDEDNS
jgi:hypothetical protein